MSDAVEARVWETLKQVKFPGMSRDVVSFGFVESVVVEGSDVAVELRVPTQNPGAGEQIRDNVEQALAGLDGVARVKVGLHVVAPKSAAQSQQRAVMTDPELLPGTRRIIAVASGKGGVGKSTVSANLAIRLAQMGHRVGLLDSDIYGPSMPIMFGIDEKPRVADNRLLPFEKYGVRLMSLGFILDMDTPVIWRGPMVMKAIEQLIRDVEWGELDYMVVDLPPGTGDAQLTLTQRVPLSGAVIVSTPQDVALIDARKGLAMFRKVNVPVLGFVENMSYYVCPSCGERNDIFKHGGARAAAEELGCRFLGDIPLDAEIVRGGDGGEPIVVKDEHGPFGKAFEKIALGVIEEAERHARDQPSLSIL
jgi:ATP-binding protein involved in chromosome partitioning